MFKRTDQSDGNTSFLPEDYIVRQTERRTNLIALTLFAIVIFGVVAAFFVTNRQWSAVKQQQESINARYTEAAQQIEMLKTLERQKEQKLGKAELATVLIEKIPRSLLLADLINRMPEKLALLEFTLTSTKVEPPPASASPAPGKPRSLAGRAIASATGKQDEPDTTPKPPTYRSTLTLVGVAPSHEDVSQYLASLQASPLLRDVTLRFSEFTMLDNRELIKFRIDAALDAAADARSIEPLTATRAGAFDTGRVAGVDGSGEPEEER
ncbi:MAG: hypothetical protein D6693_06565 [Planctomycetota bacterium]|nr:MAG: hypothetical protein D6693_06565 [Planctomycetota bacterium]